MTTIKLKIKKSENKATYPPDHKAGMRVTKGGSMCANCFPKDTRISTSKGAVKITDIKIGDLVLGELNGKIVLTPVLAIGNRKAKKDELIRISFEIENNKQRNKLVTTLEHPFFVCKKNKYVEAKDLKVGDELYHLDMPQIHSILKAFNNPMSNKETAKKVSNAFKKLYAEGIMKPRVLSAEAKKRMSEDMKINNPMFNRETALLVASKKNYHELGTISWTKRQDRKWPTSIELRVLKLCEKNNLPIWYCGDGSYWIKGGTRNFNPDFKIRGQKKIIEAWNLGFPNKRDYKWAASRKKQIEETGYKCLMLEISKNKTDDELLGLIQNFLSNGIKIKEVLPISQKRMVWSQIVDKNNELEVFNIQTGTGNYFVKGIKMHRYVLVHNCEYVNGQKCTNPYFIKWNGSDIIPEPTDEYCSDYWEAKDNDDESKEK